MPRQVRREEEEAKKRRRWSKRGGLPVGLEHGRGWRLKGWRRVVARKRGSVIVPLLPFPLTLTPTSIHAHTDTRTRGQESHPHPPSRVPPAHQAGTNLCTHATPRIHDRTRENRRMHVLSDAVTRTRNMHTQCSRVVSTLPFGWQRGWNTWLRIPSIMRPVKSPSWKSSLRIGHDW